MLKKFYNSKYTQIGAYVVFVAAIIIAINSFIDNVPYFFTLLWDKVTWVISSSKPIVLAIVFAYLLDPVADMFENLLLKIKPLKKRCEKKKKSCRGGAVLLTVVTMLAVVSLVVTILVISVTDNVKVVNFDDVTDLVVQYKDTIEKLRKPVMDTLDKANIESSEIEKYIKDASNIILNWLSTGAQSAVRSISNITGIITSFFISLVIMIYLLADGKHITSYVSKVSYAIFNEKMNKKIRGFVKDVDTVFSGYIRGQLMDAFVMMTLVSIGLSIIGVEFAMLIGILTGLGNLIPYVGPFFAYGGVIVSSIMFWDPKTFIVAMIFLVVLQLIDGNVIGPKLLSSSVEVHPMLVVIFLLFGSAIGGLLGMLLAVPVGALIKVLFVRFIDKRLKEKNINL